MHGGSNPWGIREVKGTTNPFHIEDGKKPKDERV
jgi:hypothetical protein